MRQMGWVYVGSAGAFALQLLVVACGHGEKNPVTSAGGAANGDAGQSSGGKASTGGSASHGGSGSGVVTDLDGFLEAEGVGFCARLFSCFEGNDDFTSERLVLKTEQGCRDFLARINRINGTIRDLRAQIAAGAVHYDPENGQKCLDALSACNGADSLTDGPCREAFDGNAKTGEACQRSEDCEGDAYCTLSASCPGQCAPRKQEGETCDISGDCAYTTGVVFCDRSSATAVCHTLEPSPKAAAGEPCTRNLEGATSLILCQDELWCATLAGGDSAADAVGHCVAPIEPDGPCVDGDDVCSAGICHTAGGACHAITFVTKGGAVCDKAAYQICDPTLGLHCNAAGTCDASGDGSEGSVCYTGDLMWGCDPGLFCAKGPDATSEVPGICTALLADGAACERDDNCISSNCEAKVCGGRPCLR